MTALGGQKGKKRLRYSLRTGYLGDTKVDKNSPS